MCRMGIGVEFVYGEVVDADKSDSALNQKFRAVGLQVYKILVKFSVLPMTRVVCLKEDPFNSIPTESFQICAANGFYAWDLKDRSLSHQSVESKFIKFPAAGDHMEWGVHVGARMRPHPDIGKGDNMRVVFRCMGLPQKLHGRIPRPHRHRIRDRYADVVNHQPQE